MNDIDYLMYILLKSHILFLLILLISYILEKYTGLYLFFKDLKWEKSKYMAEGAANLHSIFYFLISLSVIIYDAYIKDRAPEKFLFGSWILVMIPLTIIFRFAIYFLTAKDPNKDGEHFE